MFGGAPHGERVQLPNGHATYYEMARLGAERRSLIARWARWTAETWEWYVENIRSGRGFTRMGLPLFPVIGGAMGVQDGLLIKSQVIVFQVSLTPASVATIVHAEQALTVTGILAADVLAYSANSVNAATAVGATTGHVSAANTIQQGYVNPTAGALVPTPGTYNIVVLRG
jgi:hypothetical protein